MDNALVINEGLNTPSMFGPISDVPDVFSPFRSSSQTKMGRMTLSDSGMKLSTLGPDQFCDNPSDSIVKLGLSKTLTNVLIHVFLC